MIVLGYTPGESVVTNFTLGIFCALLCCVGWASEAVICAYGLKDPNISDEHALPVGQIASAVFYGVVILTVLGGWDFTLDIAFTPTSANILSALFGTASYVCYYRAISTIGATKGDGTEYHLLRVVYYCFPIILAPSFAGFKEYHLWDRDRTGIYYSGRRCERVFHQDRTESIKRVI